MCPCMRCLLAVHLQPFLRVTAAAEAGVETSVLRSLILKPLVLNTLSKFEQGNCFGLSVWYQDC